MATAKLIGADDATIDAAQGAGWIAGTQVTADASGNMTEFRIKSNGSAHVKVGLYSNVPGSPDLPGSRLGFVNTSTAIVSGWNTISFPSTPIVAGIKYWLLTKCDAEGIIGAHNATGIPYAYRNDGYAADLPDPIGSGLYTATIYKGIYAGWGIRVLSPSGINQPISYGMLEVIITSAPIIQPSSIHQVVAIGAPVLCYPQTISPSSIIQPVYIGTLWVGIFGFIRPQSTIQQISIGSPTILKYVWHVILDGQYAIETPGVNRTYIIGRDQYGNPVYGTAVNAEEIALVGERLDFQPDPAIPTTARAGDVAAAILAKMRLSGKRGFILIPPNCGQELFDVVQISDLGANQSVVKFRVVGIEFEYNVMEARYQHRLILESP